MQALSWDVLSNAVALFTGLMEVRRGANESWLETVVFASSASAEAVKKLNYTETLESHTSQTL